MKKQYDINGRDITDKFNQLAMKMWATEIDRHPHVWMERFTDAPEELNVVWFQSKAPGAPKSILTMFRDDMAWDAYHRIHCTEMREIAKLTIPEGHKFDYALPSEWIHKTLFPKAHRLSCFRSFDTDADREEWVSNRVQEWVLYYVWIYDEGDPLGRPHHMIGDQDMLRPVTEEYLD